MLQFTNTEACATTNGIKVLVYGGAGAGKTMLCATLPQPVIISNESGLLSLSKKNIERVHGVNNPLVTYNIPVITIETIEDLNNAFRWCAEAAEAKAFASIGLDSISEMAETILNNAKRTVKDPRQAYGELIERAETIVRKFRDLPGRNIYFASKMEPLKDEFSGVVRYGPSMPGSKLGHKMPYFFDEVFRLAIGQNPQNPAEKFRYLQTQPDMQYEAKDRSGALAAMEYPHLGAIFQKIIGE